MIKETSKNALYSKGVQGSMIVILTALVAIAKSWHDGGFDEDQLVPALIMLWGGIQALWGRWTARKAVRLPRLGSGCLLLCLMVLFPMAGCHNPRLCSIAMRAEELSATIDEIQVNVKNIIAVDPNMVPPDLLEELREIDARIDMVQIDADAIIEITKTATCSE